MANKQAEICSTSHVIRKMQTETSMRYYHEPTRQDKIRILVYNMNCWQECKATGMVSYYWWKYKTVVNLVLGPFLASFLPPSLFSV